MIEKKQKTTIPVPENASGSVETEVFASSRDTEASGAEQARPEASEAVRGAADTTTAESAAIKAEKANEKQRAKRSPRSRNLMYEQQLVHLPPHVTSLDDLCQLIEDALKPDRFAVVLHDKDLNKEGKLVEPHYQAFMSFRNPRSCSGVAKQLGDRPQTVTAWDNRANNGFCYLIHATDKARMEGKYQYDPAAVRANFDYATLIQGTTQQVEKARIHGDCNRTKVILDMVYAGTMSRKEAENLLPGHVMGRIKRQLDDVEAKHLERAAAEWRKDMAAQGKAVRVVWFYGRPGTGKTSVAKVLAEKTGQPYFISGSTRDIFQSYAGEHTIILDELRAGSIPYADLLRILDPYSIQSGVMAPSRYSDKALACDLFFVTSPYDPRQFYDELYPIGKGQKEEEQTDSFEQLLRRITITVCMTATEILLAKYDEKGKAFVTDTSSRRPNPYSAASRPASEVNVEEMFTGMFPAAP